MAEIFRLRRSPAQIAELRDLCALWGPPAIGSERFWGFDDVLAAVTRPGCIALIAAAHADAPWEGVAFAEAGADTADLMYVYVKAACRKSGVARALLGGLIATLAAETTAESLFLEVRIGNRAAQKLYESYGMQRIGARPRYYADGEDALVYRLEIAR